MTDAVDTSRSTGRENPRAVGAWLMASAFMVFCMMLIGAVTRLTESGLSMVEWRPFIGWIPPLGEGEWQRIFDLYRATSEYQIDNLGMSLEEFKTIFWWEYIHRVWGRLIGLVYGLPMIWFFVTRQVPAGYGKHLLILLFLGGLQGFIGWWMVKSGFVDRADVSQYRLAVHLGMAFLILGYLVYLAIGLLYPIEPERDPASRGFRRVGALAHEVIFVTVLSGALVAGLNAGFAYNEWPLMGNGFLPPADEFWELQPWWLNFFESLATVQFNHRTMAYVTILAVAVLWIWSRRVELAPRARLSINCLALMLGIQVCLGISTLLLIIPIELAVMHQGGAALTFCLSLWVMKELRGAPRK